MKIPLIKNQLNFKSGLSKKDIERMQKITPEYTKKYFKTKGVKTDFKDNRTYSIVNFLCCQILNRLGILKNPKQIVVFDKTDLEKPYPDTFCTAATKKILKNEPPIKAPSLFFQNDKYTLEEMNEIAQDMKKNHFISNDNFLSLTMHEWAHNRHFSYLYSFLGSESEVIKYLKELNEFNFSEKEKEIVSQYLGDYVYNNGKIKATEVIAEGLNKTVCACLDDKKIQINKDIKDSINDTPKELKDLMKKILDFRI